MPTPPLYDHPSLQFWPSRWKYNGEGLATILIVRSEMAIELSKPASRGTYVGPELYRWARGRGIRVRGLSDEEDDALRARLLDEDSVWIDLWTLWRWGWSRDTSTRPCAPLPKAGELDAAAERFAPDLPKGLPLVPNRWTHGARP